MSVAQLAQGRVPKAAKRAAKRDSLYLASLAVLGIIVVAALAGPWLALYDPNELYVGPVNGMISLAHPFGTDDVGRDILSRALVGASASVFAPVMVVILSTIAGAGLAIIAAWYGGVLRGVIARLVDVIFAI